MTDHSQRRHYPTNLIFVDVFVVAYASGFASSLIFHRDRVRQEAEQMSRLFIVEAIRADIIRMDQVRLAETELQFLTHPARQHR